MAGQMAVSRRQRPGASGLIGGPMLAVGLFVALAPATAAAGSWMLLGIPVAAVVAMLSSRGAVAVSARRYGPASGYAAVRWRVGVIPGRISASTSLVGYVAAMSAVAGAIGQYLSATSAKAIAAATILIAVSASTAGLRIRGVVGRVWFGWTVAVAAVVIAACLAIPPVASPSAVSLPDSGLGITGAAGVLFVSYLGFEERASRGERDRPSLSMIATMLILLITAVALLYQLGPVRLALSPTPVADALGAAAAATLAPAVGVGIAVAMVPALLASLESFGSTARALVADGDLPRFLGRTSRNEAPYLLTLAAGIAAAALAQVLDPAAAIELSACCLLVHYAFANMAARLLPDDDTRPTKTACAAMVLCVLLIMSMPVFVMVSTLAIAVVGPVLAGAVSGRWR